MINYKKNNIYNKAVEKIRCIFDDNYEIGLLFLHKLEVVIITCLNEK